LTQIRETRPWHSSKISQQIKLSIFLRADIDSRTLHRDIVTKDEDEEEELVAEEPIVIMEEDIEEEELEPPRAEEEEPLGASISSQG
jgi:hypothetical protein